MTPDEIERIDLGLAEDSQAAENRERVTFLYALSGTHNEARRTVPVERPEKPIEGIAVDSWIEYDGKRHLMLLTERGLVAAQTDVRVVANCRVRLVPQAIQPWSGVETMAWSVHVLGLGYTWSPLENQNRESVTQAADRWLEEIRNRAAAMVNRRHEMRSQVRALNQQRSTVNPGGQTPLSIGTARRLAKVSVYGPAWANTMKSLADASSRVRTIRSQLRQLSLRQEWSRRHSWAGRYWLVERPALAREGRELRRELRAAKTQRRGLIRKMTSLQSPKSRREIVGKISDLTRKFIHEDKRLGAEIGSIKRSAEVLEQQIAASSALVEKLRSLGATPVTMDQSTVREIRETSLPKLVHHFGNQASTNKLQASKGLRV